MIVFSILPLLTLLIAIIFVLNGIKLASDCAKGDKRFDYPYIGIGIVLGAATILVGSLIIILVSFLFGGTAYTDKKATHIITFKTGQSRASLAHKNEEFSSKKFYYYTNENGYNERHTVDTGDQKVIIKYDNAIYEKPYVINTSGCSRTSAAKYFVPCIRPDNRVVIFHLNNKGQVAGDLEPPETLLEKSGS